MKTRAAPPINGVIETILYVDDLPRAVAFYTEIMGLGAIAGDGVRFRVFDSGAGRALLLFKRGATLTPTPVRGGVIPPHDGSGPHHIAFAIAAGDYEPWKARLAACGVAVGGGARWERGAQSVYFRDPDGHLLEFVTPGIWPIY